MARGYFPCVSSVSTDIEKEVERERGSPEGPKKEQNSKRKEEQMSPKIAL